MVTEPRYVRAAPVHLTRETGSALARAVAGCLVDLETAADVLGGRVLTLSVGILVDRGDVYRSGAADLVVRARGRVVA